LDAEEALLDQMYVIDDSLSVADAIKKEAEKHGGTAEIVQFVKYEVGEGIEKKACNLAQEVAEQLGE
ncbi:MAG: elongation factor Ts, partial [Candidatus Magasanikbacteria bacterium]|nr:elongation factor Ts [Candidatus Magasanikbacteria bacterium]